MHFLIFAAILGFFPVFVNSYNVPLYVESLVTASELLPDEYYDYIVVGGGTAGCPLAATLSEKFKVLVLERGGVPYGNHDVMYQEGFLENFMANTGEESPVEMFLSQDGVPNARGRVLGGSSTINAGFYSRGDTEFFQRSGREWNFSKVNQSFEWVESGIVFKPELNNWQSAFRQALLQANVTPDNHFTLHHVNGTKVGGSTFDRNGQRYTAADLLSYSNSSNIKIALYATAERITFSPTSDHKSPRVKANGVIFRDRLGQSHQALLKDSGEIILSAGTIGSPQLLLLSGVGPRRDLLPLGIPLVYHSPYVGQFVQDNPRNSISIVSPIPLNTSLIQVVGSTGSGNYIEAASNVIEFGPFRRPVLFQIPFPARRLSVATIIEKIADPLSTGSIRLATSDVRVHPIVQFNYFSNLLDLQKCISGLQKIAEILQTQSMNQFKFRLLLGSREFRYLGPRLPRNISDSIMMGNFCQRTVSTIWHYHGGCLVGKVVDENYRVLGVDSLRVVDGSTFVSSPGTNPQATVMMIGRYVASEIIMERVKTSKDAKPSKDVKTSKDVKPSKDVKTSRDAKALKDVTASKDF